MFDRLKRTITRPKVPEYTAVREAPTRGLPFELTEQEAGQSHSDRRDAIERSLREFPRRPEAESLSHAQASARAGELYNARDVLLETAAHVSFEDPRVHMLLGQVAVALRDRELLHEAKAYLKFFKLSSWEHKLDEVVQSGSPDFEFEI
jgi:hypothetical protein